MADKTVSNEEITENVLIEETPKGFRSLWSHFKKSPNRLAWLSLGVFLFSSPFLLPYLFFGTYVTLHYLSFTLLVAFTMYLLVMWWFYPSEVNVLTKVIMFFLVFVSFGLGFRWLNWDKHVLVDYHDGVEVFPYVSMTEEFSNSLLSETNSFTISVKPKLIIERGPDFSSLTVDVHNQSKEYLKTTFQEDEFKPFTIYYGADVQGKTGDIRGKRTDYGWFGSTSTDFVIELEK